jgi:hypothetical protein
MGPIESTTGPERPHYPPLTAECGDIRCFLFVDCTSETMYTSHMSDIVARGCSEDLVRTAKAAAALEGVFFNEWIRRAVEAKLGGRSAVDGIQAPFRNSELAVDAPAVEGAPRTEKEGAEDGAPVKDCEICLQPCTAWGPQKRHCGRCGRNFQR